MSSNNFITKDNKVVQHSGESIFSNFLTNLQNNSLTEPQLLKILDDISKYENQIDDKRYIKYDPKIVLSIQLALAKSVLKSNSITITMTTCKRFDLFEQTMNSFIQCCLDINQYVYEWIIIDDNSSQEDRQKMQSLYPFVKFVFKTQDQKGHANSMNMILQLVKTPYIFHMEDDWRFFHKDNYLTKCLAVINKDEKYGQCLLNRAYSEDLVYGSKIVTGYQRNIPFQGENLRYYIHEYITGPYIQKMHDFITKSGYSHCIYWPHYSLRVGLTKKQVYDTIGQFNPNAQHFEMEYAHRYVTSRFLTTYLDNTFCTHIGRRTYERDSSKINAYDLNNEKQFGEVPKLLSNDNIDKIKSRIKINILNLERRPDRLEKFKQINSLELTNIQINIFKGVDGSTLNSSQKIQKLFKNNDYNYRRGIVGCALSHIKMWCEGIIDPNFDGFINIEDDAILVPKFFDKLLDCITKNPEADIIFLGHHPYPQYRKQEYYDKDRWPIAEKWELNKCIRESMGGTTAYYITKRGISNMLTFLNNNGMVNAIDWEMFKTANINNIYYCNPHLAFAECAQNNTTTDSDIQYEYSGVGFKNNDDIVNYEIEYWNEKGVRTKFKELNCIEDPSSMVICRDDNDDLKDILRTISIFKNTEENKKRFELYPLWWYENGQYLIMVPEPMVPDTLLDDRTMFMNYVNQNCKI